MEDLGPCSCYSGLDDPTRLRVQDIRSFPLLPSRPSHTAIHFMMSHSVCVTTPLVLFWSFFQSVTLSAFTLPVKMCRNTHRSPILTVFPIASLQSGVSPQLSQRSLLSPSFSSALLPSIASSELSFWGSKARSGYRGQWSGETRWRNWASPGRFSHPSFRPPPTNLQWKPRNPLFWVLTCVLYQKAQLHRAH